MSLTSFIEEAPYEEYRERFAEHFVIDRDARGVLTARMHTNGGPAVWGMELHRALGQLFKVVAADDDNEVLILTGTGDYWIDGIDAESFRAVERDDETFRRESYFKWYRDGMKLQENLIWDVDIPTIAAINGPGHHQEFALLCDMTICSENTKFVEAHYAVGLAPGDALFLVLQEQLGYKRANYAMYTAQSITAEEALTWGLVNEVVAKDELLGRAVALANTVLDSQPDPVVRRITSRIVKRRWRRLLTDDFEMHFGHEMWATMVHRQDHGAMDLKGIVGKG
ncbi:enoyl-CoA hydratase/isomerase family protein [Aeromicrobium phragmitis]|uniref:Enoyl-CoA hydratase/isomerase family protein n=1 Tax=Aeromicrobium phragmitis TaxID=2478914 RepID=A0A3L8PJT9_9ACTN|nr:enoyl-CoA hydratase/isomerase family protein [Aeromicrobium phragmitis]RLV55666.1 enoyl-CoA hydratase/isomerase family protein [Aeromicrobium phragmitis]